MKKKPGQALEDLVAAIESLLCAGGGFEVIRNQKLRYERTPFAEFDVIVQGKAGSNPVRALLECRDRRKRAPAEWIHMLAGKMDYHKFTSVTAVSTGGFTKGCLPIANRAGIELRHVSRLEASEVLPGIFPIAQCQFFHGVTFRRATIHFVPGTAEDVKGAAKALMMLPNMKDLRVFSIGGKLLTIWDCFWQEALNSMDLLREAWEKHGEEASFLVNYSKPAVLEMITSAGTARVGQIRFYHQIVTTFNGGPPTAVMTYASETTGEIISRSASFTIDVPDHGKKTITLHAVPNGGGTTVGLSVDG